MDYQDQVTMGSYQVLISNCQWTGTCAGRAGGPFEHRPQTCAKSQGDDFPKVSPYRSLLRPQRSYNWCNYFRICIYYIIYYIILKLYIYILLYNYIILYILYYMYNQLLFYPIYSC